MFLYHNDYLSDTLHNASNLKNTRSIHNYLLSLMLINLTQKRGFNLLSKSLTSKQNITHIASYICTQRKYGL